MRMKYQWHIFWFVSTLIRNVQSHLFRHAATQNKGDRVRFDHQATLASGVISLSTSLRTSKNFEKPVVIILQNKQVRKYQYNWRSIVYNIVGFLLVCCSCFKISCHNSSLFIPVVSMRRENKIKCFPELLACLRSPTSSTQGCPSFV